MALFDDHMGISLFLDHATPRRDWLEGLFRQIWSQGGRFTQLSDRGSWEQEIVSANLGTTTIKDILTGFSEQAPSVRFHLFANGMLVEASLGFSPSSPLIKGGILLDVHWRYFARLRDGSYTANPPATLPFINNYRSLLHIVEVICDYSNPLYGYGYYLERDQVDEFVQAEENKKIISQLEQGQLPDLSVFLFHTIFQYFGVSLVNANTFLTLKQPGEDVRQFASGGLMTIPLLQPFTDEMNEAYRYIESANYYLSEMQNLALRSQDRRQALVHAKNAIAQAQNLFIEIQKKNAQDNSQEQYAREGLLSYQRIAQQVATLERELAHS